MAGPAIMTGSPGAAALTSGVHHVALGVRDLRGMQAFYRDQLGFTEVLMAFDDVAPEVMQEVARSQELVFSGAILNQPGGGILLELIRMTRPEPRPLRSRSRYGDVGVGKVTVRVPDVHAFHRAYNGRLTFCSEPRVARIPGVGDQVFVLARDPEGNLVEFMSAPGGGAGEGVDGIRSVGVGVTDLDRSTAFYRDVLDLKPAAGSPHEAFSGLVDEAADGASVRVRSCLLEGAGGEGRLELIQVFDPPGRSIPFGAAWGDFGYLQVCFSCADINAAVTRLEAAGAQLLCGPKPAGEGSFEETGAFVYARDPDGAPIEFLFLPS